MEKKSCSDCCRLFRTIRSLEKYERNILASEGPLKVLAGCSECGEEFTSKYALSIHLHKVHGFESWSEIMYFRNTPEGQKGVIDSAHSLTEKEMLLRKLSDLLDRLETMSEFELVRWLNVFETVSEDWFRPRITTQ